MTDEVDEGEVPRRRIARADVLAGPDHRPETDVQPGFLAYFPYGSILECLPPFDPSSGNRPLPHEGPMASLDQEHPAFGDDRDADAWNRGAVSHRRCA